MGYASVRDDAVSAVAAALAGHAEGLAVATTGSTGAPREVLLPTAALRASATATHARLGGPGRWLLALPTDKVAGAMVLVRSALAGTEPVAVPGGSFTPAAFAAATERIAAAGGERLYTALVPTQVIRLARDPAGAAALARYSTVLVGGAAPPHELPPNAVVTYGMTETCGGCIYDGVPLDGVEAAVGDDGRVLLAGPTLAAGYADGDDSAFVTMAGQRWLRTADVGEVTERGLEVLGRADDVIITGGHKVHPALVEAAILATGVTTACAVVGVPDVEWGQAVVAVVEQTPHSAAVTAESLRERLGARLPRYALPRRIVPIASMPTLAPGKISREAARQVATRHAGEDA